jgi:hypothetical protein
MQKITVFIIIIVLIIAVAGYFGVKELFRGTPPLASLYSNTEYGFSIQFPLSWSAYSIDEQSWEGHVIDNYQQTYSGPLIIIKNPELFAKGFIGIPIMVITPEIWKLISEEKIAVSAAPIGPGKVGQNQKYIFATPPRYIGFVGDLSTDEINQVYNIVKTFKAF